MIKPSSRKPRKRVPIPSVHVEAPISSNAFVEYNMNDSEADTNLKPTINVKSKRQKTKPTIDEQLFSLRMQLGELGNQEFSIQAQKNKLSKSIKKLMKKLSLQNADKGCLVVTESTPVTEALNIVFCDPVCNITNHKNNTDIINENFEEKHQYTPSSNSNTLIPDNGN